MTNIDDFCVNWEEVWSEPAYDQNYLAWPLVPAERLSALIGAAKTGKSLLALEAGVCIATGRDFLGKPTIQGTVLYIDMENLVTADTRTRLMAMGFQPWDLQNFMLASFPSIPFLDTAGGGRKFEELLDRYQPVLVVLDTAVRLIGGKESDNDTWNSFYMYAEIEAKKRKVAILRIDHYGKDTSKGARGASSKYTDIDVSWSLTKKIGSNKLKLEALHHRMPIDCGKLELERVDQPILHHEVISATSGVTPSHSSASIADLISALDDFGAPDKLSQGQTAEILRTKLNYRFGNDILSEVCANRKKRQIVAPMPRPKLTRPIQEIPFVNDSFNENDYKGDKWESTEKWDEDGNPIYEW